MLSKQSAISLIFGGKIALFLKKNKHFNELYFVRFSPFFADFRRFSAEKMAAFLQI
jgi:hypothetical protein